MPMDLIGQIGVGGLLAILIVREVLTHLRSRKFDGNGKQVDFHKMAYQMHDLHTWHNKEDEDGVKVWYVKSSLEKSIDRLSENVETQTEVIRELVLEVKRSNGYG